MIFDDSALIPGHVRVMQDMPIIGTLGIEYPLPHVAINPNYLIIQPKNADIGVVTRFQRIFEAFYRFFLCIVVGIHALTAQEGRNNPGTSNLSSV